MKRNSLLLLLVAAVLLASAYSAVAVPMLVGPTFNFPNINPFNLYQYVAFQMRQGWVDGELAWFICTDASDQQLACQQQQLLLNGGAAPAQPIFINCFNTINFAPRLTNLAGQLPIVYFVTGQPQPVFTAVPGDPDYSGLWQVVFVTFNPGVTRHCVDNADPYDPVTNPTGLPSAADATFTATNRAGNPVVVKYPIMAVGPLGGPWYPAPAGTTTYRIPQGRVYSDYAYYKVIFLPYWNVYCQDPITRRVCVRQIVIPDACDPPGLPLADQLVPRIGANNAPGLCLLTDMQNFYWQVGPQPNNQYPILEACPTDYLCPCQNINYEYTPVERVVVLQRNVPPLPQSTVITNEPVLLDFIGAGCLTVLRSNQIIDGTVVPNRRVMVNGTH